MFLLFVIGRAVLTISDLPWYFRITFKKIIMFILHSTQDGWCGERWRASGGVAVSFRPLCWWKLAQLNVTALFLPFGGWGFFAGPVVGTYSRV